MIALTFMGNSREIYIKRETYHPSHPPCFYWLGCGLHKIKKTIKNSQGLRIRRNPSFGFGFNFDFDFDFGFVFVLVSVLLL